MAWDPDRLADLRRKYGEAHGGELFNPDYRQVADKIFSASGTRLAPYAGVPTLLSAPYRPVDAQDPDFGNLQVAMVGMPMDLGVTNRPGARFGPRALRTIERIGPYNHVLGCAPVQDLRVADIGDVPFPQPLSASSSAMRTSSGASARSSRPAWCRSRSAATIRSPIRSCKAVGRERPVGLIHIDAHCDTGGPFDRTKFHHGGPFRNAVLDGVLDPTAHGADRHPRLGGISVGVLHRIRA